MNKAVKTPITYCRGKRKAMSAEIILDENGKVTPEGPLYKQLDEWHDKDEYQKIAKAVLNRRVKKPDHLFLLK